MPESNDETTFTKLDPESLTPELQETYKNMQADYTRKTQAVAELRKSFETKDSDFNKINEELGAAKERLGQWENWYQTDYKTPETDPNDLSNQSIEDILKSLTEPSGTDGDLDDSTPNAMDPGVVEIMNKMQTKITDLETALGTVGQSVKDTSTQTNRMFQLQSTINDLKKADPDMDANELLTFATENKITDLNKAYKMKYQDKIVEKLAIEKLAELQKTERANGVKGPGNFIRPSALDNKPKSYAGATQAILTDKAANGTLE